MRSMENKYRIIEDIRNSNTYLGIELGSTRIKSVLIDSKGNTITIGNYEWESKLENGNWTYYIKDIWKGIQESYADLKMNIENKYEENLIEIGAIGFSGMMHGYMPFDKNKNLLTSFRTWRNSNTEEASTNLIKEFGYNIPQRWSIAHLYQAILNQEKHVKDIDYLTTLPGYVHWILTGEKVLGIGDASGMFPIDININNYNYDMINKFNSLIEDRNYPWELEGILPEVKMVGDEAGRLTKEGARLLDLSEDLKPGIPLCPPEGDAGTGMVATNSIKKRTGNVSVGTSIFAMIVLEKELNKVYPEIDLVTTPTGDLVGMIHANNGTAEINSWVNIFRELLEELNIDIDINRLYDILFNKALLGDSDCGDLLSYGYHAGENIVKINEGRPLFVRTPDSNFNLANFIKVNLYSTLAIIKIGMDILTKEDIKIDSILGHGGFFKTPMVGQKIMSAALNIPVTIMDTAGEGGAWGMALLASYMDNKSDSKNLSDFLDNKIFDKNEGTTIKPNENIRKEFEIFIKKYIRGLEIEKSAIRNL